MKIAAKMITQNSTDFSISGMGKPEKKAASLSPTIFLEQLDNNFKAYTVTTPKLEELELVKRSISGDQRAQLQLYRKYVTAMFNTVIRMINNRADAEDIIQEVFITVFQKLTAFRAESTLGAWIKRITINTTLNFIRQRRDIYFMESEVLESKLDHEEKEQIEPQFNMTQIHHAVKALPEGCRLVFNLFLLEGYSHQEISEILSISESTSKTQYRRAKLLVAKHLKTNY